MLVGYLKLVSCPVFMKTLIFKSIERIKCATFQTENQERMDPIAAILNNQTKTRGWWVGGVVEGMDGNHARKRE